MRKMVGRSLFLKYGLVIVAVVFLSFFLNVCNAQQSFGGAIVGPPCPFAPMQNGPPVIGILTQTQGYFQDGYSNPGHIIQVYTQNTDPFMGSPAPWGLSFGQNDPQMTQNPLSCEYTLTYKTISGTIADRLYATYYVNSSAGNWQLGGVLGDILAGVTQVPMKRLYP